MRRSTGATLATIVLAAASALLGAGCGGAGEEAAREGDAAGTATVQLRIEGMT